MKIITLFITLNLFVSSCKKGNNTDTLPPSTDKCRGRYDKELFTSLKATLHLQYGTALNIAGSQENLLLDLYEPGNDTATKRAMIMFVHGGAWIGVLKCRVGSCAAPLLKKVM
jgi:acetyl esterase/lipase